MDVRDNQWLLPIVISFRWSSRIALYRHSIGINGANEEFDKRSARCWIASISHRAKGFFLHTSCLRSTPLAFVETICLTLDSSHDTMCECTRARAPSARKFVANADSRDVARTHTRPYSNLFFSRSCVVHACACVDRSTINNFQGHKMRCRQKKKENRSCGKCKGMFLDQIRQDWLMIIE